MAAKNVMKLGCYARASLGMPRGRNAVIIGRSRPTQISFERATILPTQRWSGVTVDKSIIGGHSAFFRTVCQGCKG